MIKAIIIDDESKARDLLELLLEEQEMPVQIVAKCPDLMTGILQIKKHKPDVVFLDIEMPEFSGLQILEHIPEPDFEIIFATAYDQYAIKAFELSALGYLLKPIDEDKLVTCIEKLNQKMELKTRLQAYEQNRQRVSPVKICIPSSQSDFDVILVKDILAIEADRNYSIIHTSKQKYMLSKSLSYFVDKYLPIEGFVRTHRSWIVNTSQVNKLVLSTKELHLEGFVVPISRSKFADVKRLLAQS